MDSIQMFNQTFINGRYSKLMFNPSLLIMKPVIYKIFKLSCKVNDLAYK